MGFSCPEGGLGIGSLSALLTGLDGGVGVEVEGVHEKDGIGSACFCSNYVAEVDHDEENPEKRDDGFRA